MFHTYGKIGVMKGHQCLYKYTSLSTTTGMYVYMFQIFRNFEIALHSLEIDNMHIYIYIAVSKLHNSCMCNLEISRHIRSGV